jgi:hypothetical protein
MRRWIIISGLFALGLFFGVTSFRITHKPVPDVLFYLFGAVTIAFISMLLYNLLQKRKF